MYKYKIQSYRFTVYGTLDINIIDANNEYDYSIPNKGASIKGVNTDLRLVEPKNMDRFIKDIERYKLSTEKIN